MRHSPLTRFAVAGGAAMACWLVAATPALAAGPSPNCGTGGTLTHSVDRATFSCTYTATGEDSFTVPAGVASVSVTAVGAPGASGSLWHQSQPGALGSPGAGADGAIAAGALTVTSGQALYVEVGGGGRDANGCPVACGGGSNGGGAGGTDVALGGGSSGGGGGGASDVRTVSCALRCPGDAASLASRLLVAGGGGGGGGGGFSSAATTASDGGAGGGASAVGVDGFTGTAATGALPGNGGGGGTSTAGGALGVPGIGCTTATPATAGIIGVGGAGNGDTFGGGGGGGGYYGGGGGGAGCSAGAFGGDGGGGGGSSYGPTGTTFTQDATGAPLVVISWTVASPAASITAPAAGAIYAVGQSVQERFTCQEGGGGPGLRSCLDQNGSPSGTTLDTSTPGTHTVTVTATSADGLSGSASESYTVVAARPTDDDHDSREAGAPHAGPRDRDPRVHGDLGERIAP